jgi:hypothetical protein
MTPLKMEASVWRGKGKKKKKKKRKGKGAQGRDGRGWKMKEND